jgi:hypothetical protein
MKKNEQFNASNTALFYIDKSGNLAVDRRQLDIANEAEKGRSKPKKDALRKAVSPF